MKTKVPTKIKRSSSIKSTVTALFINFHAPERVRFINLTNMQETDNAGGEPNKKPLVATLVMAPAAQEYFNELRRQHFPPERNHLNAHLTLFHALPDEPWVVEDLDALARAQQPFEATAQAITSLGFGTAFKIISPELPALHQKLQKRWAGFLTSQDRQKRNFHITVQNKVEPGEAKKLQAGLSAVFTPFTFTISGIQLWRYEGGPWTFLRTIEFGI
jgi:2'-5' RNA ligase